MANYAEEHLSRLGDLKRLAEKIKDDYSTKKELSALSEKVDGLVTAGGEPNKLEGVKVNGTELNITDKKVDVVIQVNGANAPVSGKKVNITVPTDSDIEQKVKEGIDDFATKVTSDNATVDTFAELVDYVAKHGTEVTGMLKDIGDNKSNIAKNTSAIEDINDKLDDISDGATKVEKSNTNGNIKIDGNETVVYTHPTSTAKSLGFYKTAVDATGHVTEATTVTKADITKLGIASDDLASSSANGLMSSSDKEKLDGIEIASSDEVEAMLDRVFGAKEA